MKNVKISTEYITIGQFLKFIAIISSGAEAKDFLLNEKVYVNGELESRRGRKIYDGFIVKIKNEEYKVIK